MVQTTADTGSISVPMSSFLDALQDVLTEPEREALYEQLIGVRPAEVAPGDLITAELFNKMLSDLHDLSARVATLEGAAGGPILESLDPATTVAVNGLLIVAGRNFNPIRGLNTVKIGDVEITQFRGDSTPTHLIFPVPDMFTGLPASKQVQVVTGGRTSNALSITVVEPDKTQDGNFVFSAGQAPSGAIAVGQQITLAWTVQAITHYPDNAALSLLVGSAEGATPAAWLASVAIQPPPPLPIIPGQSKQVSVKVTVPTGATSAQLSLRVASEDGHVVNVSDPLTITVGQAVEVPDPRIDISYTAGGLGSGGMTVGKVTIDGVEADGVLVKKGQNGKLQFHALDKRANGPNATFTLTAEIVGGGATGLTVGAGPSPAASPAAGIAPGGDLPFALPLSAPAGAATGATARLKVTCNQTAATGGLAPYKSFKTIPLKIVD